MSRTTRNNRHAGESLTFSQSGVLLPALLEIRRSVVPLEARLGGARGAAERGSRRGSTGHEARLNGRGQRVMVGCPGTLTSYVDAFCFSSTSMTFALLSDWSALPQKIVRPFCSFIEMVSTVRTST